MKYSAIVMLFLGAVSYTEARTDLVQIIEANGMTAVAESESESSDSNDDDEMLGLGVEKKGDSGIIDALTPPKGQCTPRLWESAEEMGW